MKANDRQLVKHTTKPRRPPSWSEGTRSKSAPLLDQATARPIAENLTKRSKSGAGYEDLIAAVGSVRASEAPGPTKASSPMSTQEPVKATAESFWHATDEPLHRSPKMRVSSPGDPAEREAEAVAKTVAAAPGEKIPGEKIRSATIPHSRVQQRHNEEDTEKVQRSASSASTLHDPTPDASDVGDATRQTINEQRGRGQTLPDPIRVEMEERFGERFGDVRVHDDATSNMLCTKLQATAFTVGNDLFFAFGKYQPESGEGRALLAHELTHVAQRASSLVIHREADAHQTVKPELSSEKKTITVPELALPAIGGTIKGAPGGINTPKAAPGFSLPTGGAPFILPPPKKRGQGAASVMWENHIRQNSKIEDRLDEQLQKQKDAASLQVGGARFYVITRKAAKAHSADMFAAGTIKELSQHSAIIRPMVGPMGGRSTLHADHILEIQLGGDDSPDNLWLLDAEVNRECGGEIRTNILNSIREEIRKIDGDAKEALPKAQTIKSEWTITFRNVVGKKRRTSTFWRREAIESGEHICLFRALTARELLEQGFDTKGERPTHINVFPNRGGGRVMRFDVVDKELKAPEFLFRGYRARDVGEMRWPPDEGGHLFEISLEKETKSGKRDGQEGLVSWAQPSVVRVRHDPRLGFGGYLTRESIREAFGEGEFTPLCPISFPDVAMSPDGELAGQGTISSMTALFPGLTIPVHLRGPELVMAFPVPTAQLDFGVFRVSEANLELGVDPGGFFIRGMAGVEVPGLGRGTLSATGYDTDVTLAGDFDLDLDILDPAAISVAYSVAEDELHAKATLGVKDGVIPGVSSGAVNISMSRDGVGVEGRLDLGGIFAGSGVDVMYRPETGLLIRGDNIPLPLTNVPGVKDATASVRVERSPETGVWSVSGGGQAALAVPGASGALGLDIDGDGFLMHGRANVAKGPASGWLDIIATNRATDESGNPIEGAPAGRSRIWGKGQASIAFGKVLTGTAGIEYTPQGQVLIDGEIALPPTVDLFERKEFEKPLFEVSTPDFPIWGVNLHITKIGIFAFADAKVSSNAFIGPGQLRDTSLKASMDLDKPTQATVDGTARFRVPAYAGLTLDIGGGLKAAVTAAYVEGRVGIDGTLGLETEAGLDVGVHWDMATGLAFDAKASVTAQPKFRIGINASVTAGIDTWFGDLEKTWGPWQKTLGEFGPNMTLGVSFPLRWTENEGLDFDISKAEVQRPQLDVKSLVFDAFQTLV